MEAADAGAGPKAAIFLSCAEEDEKIGGMLAGELKDDFQVYYWQEPSRGGWFIDEIERSIKSADIFLAVLSPSYLRSYWCTQERMMALQCEALLKEANPGASLIQVAKVADMAPTDAGFFGSYNWLDMTSAEGRREALARLGELSTARKPEPGTSETSRPRSLSTAHNEQVAPMATLGNELAFRNRVDELNQVLNGLTNAAGPHFWHVVAPPQLGKSWFLAHISTDRRLSETVPWAVRLVNLRSQPADVRDDADALLGLLFDCELAADGSPDLLGIAQQIVRSRNSHLCMIDSAELAKETANALRGYLDTICDHLKDMGDDNLRLAFIVASRRDDGWKGIIPLRLSSMPLTEFNMNVVQRALHDLAHEMGRGFPADHFRQNAMRVHRVTEGLPALLVKSLQWIRREEWGRLERLEDQNRFQELIVPYVEHELLTAGSLLPYGRGRAPKQVRALVQAYRVLVPYRLFTQSHLRHQRDANPEFRDALEAANWTITDLWGAISATSLLRRPSNELWKEIHGAIRRLLYRYFYRSDDERAAVNREAGVFMDMWSDKQVGTEQCVGLVECLWHEANALRLRSPSEIEPKLTESARKFSCALRESTAYTLDELRTFAANRMSDDVELEELVGNGDGMLSRLVEVVLDPEGCKT